LPSDRKRVQVQYRRLDDPEGYFGNRTLQTALEQALGSARNGGVIRDHAEGRAQDEDPTYGTLVLNKIDETETHFFGESVRFEKGAQLPLLSMAGHGSIYNLVQADAPRDHEPLKGVLYFIVLGNHVLFIAGEIASSRLEKYLRWLLSVAAEVITPSAGVVLAAEIEFLEHQTPAPLIERVAYTPPPFRPAEFDQSGIELGARTGKERQEIASQRTLQVLRAAGTDEADIQRLMSEKTDVELTLEISFKTGRKNKAIDLGTVGRMFRNIEPEELTFKGPRGTHIHGNLVKLSYPTEVLTVGTLLEWRDAARKLHEAYSHFITSGHLQE
jgi:hypothetical protein